MLQKKSFRSPKTLTSYLGDITAFVDFISSKGITFSGKLNRFHITSYRKSLIEQSYMREKVVDSKKDKVKVATAVKRK